MDPCLLWARAAVVGISAFTLGAIGHVTADGLLPGPVLLTLLAAATVLLSAPMLARPASRTRLLALLVGGQTVIHTVLTATAGHVGDATRPHRDGLTADPVGSLPVVDGRRVGSFQDAMTSGAGTDTGSVAPAVPIGHLLDDLTAHAPMMAVHLAAAALVALWLAHGERCLWTVLALLGHRITVVVLTVLPVVPRPTSLRRYARDLAPAGPRSVWLTRPDTRRGPPLLLA